METQAIINDMHDASNAHSSRIDGFQELSAFYFRKGASWAIVRLSERVAELDRQLKEANDLIELLRCPIKPR